MSRTNIFKDNTRYKSFFLSLLLSAIGFGLYKGVIDNYLAEVVHINELERGLTEFFRELPGLLLIVILAVFYKFSAEKMYKMGLVIMFIGMMLQAIVAPGKAIIMMVIFFYSLGEHIQLGMKNTLSLEYSRQGYGGLALGYQNSIYQIGNLAGYAVVILAFAALYGKPLFKPVFLAAAAFMGMSMLVSLRLTDSCGTDESKRRFYFSR